MWMRRVSFALTQPWALITEPMHGNDINEALIELVTGMGERQLVLTLFLLFTLATYTVLIAQPQSSSIRGSVYIFNLESVSVLDGPGTTRTVVFSLSYYGRYTLLGASVSLEPQCNATVLSSQPVQVGSWRPGTVKVASFTVDGASAPTSCPMKLIVSWGDSWDDSHSMNTQISGSMTLDAEITACWSEDLRVSITPRMVYMNSINGILLDVVNNGSLTLRNVEITVSGQGVTILNTSVPLTYRLQEIPPGKHFTTTLQLVPQSSFPSLSATVSYVDCTGNAKTKTYSIPMYASQGQSILVVPDPATVTVGTRSNVTLKVVNLGSVEADNLQVILNLQGSPLAISPAVATLGNLKPGEMKAFTVLVDVPSTASASTTFSYNAVYYTPGGGLTFTQGTFTLFILQRSSLSVTSVEVVPQKAEVGSNIVFVINLINDGTYPVYNVNVTVLPPDGLVSARSPYTFLGQLNPQVLTSVPFTFKAVKEGSYEVRFRVTYRDAYGNTAYVERAAVVNVAQASSSTAGKQSPDHGGNTFLAILVAALAVAAGFYFYRKTRSRGVTG